MDEKLDNRGGRIGPNHSIIKHIKGLRHKKNRDSQGEYIAEGIKLVSEALDSGAMVLTVIVVEEQWEALESIRHAALKKRIRTFLVSDSIFNAISDTKTPQGVLALIKCPSPSLTELFDKKKCFVVVLDGLQDPGNLGTIIRTVDAAGGDGVILLPGCVDPYNPKTVRSTMGSIFRIPVFLACERNTMMDQLIDTGFHLVTSHLMGSNVFTWQEQYEKTALVIGSEAHGASENIVLASHTLIKIPMTGGAESLNAAVAAGILIYEIFRKGMKLDE